PILRYRLCPFDDVKTGRPAAPVGKHVPPRRRRSATLGIDRHDDTLRPESLRCFLHKFRPLDCRRIDAHLVCPRLQQCPDVLKRSYSSADRQRHEHLRRRLLDHSNDGLTILMRSGDIQEAEFIGSFAIVDGCHFDRISCIAQIHKAHAFDDATVFDIEAGDNAFSQHVLAFISPLTTRRGPQRQPGNRASRRTTLSPQSPLQPVDRAPARLASPRCAKSLRKRSQGRTKAPPPPATLPDSARPTYHRGQCPYKSRRLSHTLPVP